ncbi:putative uncharacterized protein DDB_G0277255 isoform X3 [Dreissena polymorpha]|uniref:putative uncharacterized protein DDB_G0277255 isoform X3 n=1 Tax=Dreissena polymorpha TaxID=45954 RepID=UPI0022652F7F|nr:putative uncharacterized protein DDB_G0277255 isoform X3 [Dreissena polymorpha]
MSRLSRFLPKFLRGGNKDIKQTGDKSQCKIIFLDESEYFIPYKGAFKGQYVLDKAFEQLNLFEKDFFGLRFIDSTGQTHWLETTKTLASQVKGCNIPYTFYFGVKFYPADPCKLREEITRYQFFLQVKRDILHGRLPVSFEEATELFAYAVQSELGDYESQELPPGYVSEFQFVPNQTEELEESIAHLHRRLGGTIPATAELKFLDKVKWQDMYGVDLHPVMGEGNTEYFLGLTPTGIVVYKNKTKVGNYFWPRITKVNCKGKVFTIRVIGKINDEHIYSFELATKQACKHLWKCCVEHHAFFSGRQDRQNNADAQAREQPRVMRVQSRRQARRAMSDPRLNQDGGGVQFTEGHVTMVVKPEHVKGPRHRSLPELKGRESPTSTRSAPWETNMDAGLYTSGRESPVSVTQSENVNQLRRHHRDSDSEAGHRRKFQRQGYDSDGGSSRHKYFPSSRKGSDNESDVSSIRRRRREHDSGSESDVSPSAMDRYRKAKSVGSERFETEWNTALQNTNPALHSAPTGELRQKKMRRRRSKSPGNSKRPPEELRQHIEFDIIEPPEDMDEELLKEIPYVNVETKADIFKVRYSPSNRRRYRSPKRKSAGDFEGGVKVTNEPDDGPAPQARTPEATHRQSAPMPGYYSDIGSLPRRSHTISSHVQPPVAGNLTSHSKHFRSDNSHHPQFQENFLFYDPNPSNRYNTFKHTSVHSYYPPPTAVFKPIDSTQDKVSANISQSYLNSTHSTENRPVTGQGQHMDDLSHGQGHSDIGEGHDPENDEEDRNHDSGLNSSHSSSNPGVSAPSLVRGPIGRMFGTQDAIARLYSSPAGTRRPNLNQSDVSTNQNSPYKGHGYAATNQSGSPYKGMGFVSTNQQSSYNSNATAPSRGQMNGVQPVINYNSTSINGILPQYGSHSGNSSDHQSNLDYVSAPEKTNNSSRVNMQNGYLNQSHIQNPSNQSAFDMHSNRMFYTQGDSLQRNQPVNPSLQYPSQHSNLSNMKNSSHDFRPKNYNQDSVAPQRQNQMPVRSTTSNGIMEHSMVGNAGSHTLNADNRLGLQPKWQYVGNGQAGGVRSEQPHSESVHHGQQREVSISSNTRSPVSSPVKNTQPQSQSSKQGTRSPATNGNIPSYHMTSPNKQSVSRSMAGNPRDLNIETPVSPTTFRSPDSAISSLHSLSLSNPNSNRSSPRKPVKYDDNHINNNDVSRVNNNAASTFSKTRAPAFGNSERWTEL